MSILHLILMTMVTMVPPSLSSSKSAPTFTATATATATAAATAAAATAPLVVIAHDSADIEIPKPAPTTPVPPPATRPVPDMPIPLATFIGVLLIFLGVLGGYLAGVFGPRGGAGIAGPIRLEATAPVMPILTILLIGGGCWLGGQMLFFAIRAAQHMHATGERNFGPEHLQPADLAIVATVPALVAMLITLAADTAFGLRHAIGVRVAQLPRMLLVGVVSGVIAMLLVFGASYLVGVIYELVKFQHPSEHELLGAMKQASQFEKSILVIGACVVAPLFEELLFRGHLQTLLVRLFTRATTTPPTPVMPAPAPAPPIGPEGVPLYDIPAAAATTAVAVAPTAPMDSSNSAMPTYDSKRARWLAVTITALIFALVHPLWTAPLIFLLALCLGYAYERTGSIWVPIVMHAMFNISSTFLFLNFM